MNLNSIRDNFINIRFIVEVPNYKLFNKMIAYISFPFLRFFKVEKQWFYVRVGRFDFIVHICLFMPFKP